MCLPISLILGGSHDPSNLTLRCSACHAAHHAGLLTISGTAPHAIVTTRNVVPHHRPPLEATLPVSPHRTEAIAALSTLGWKRGVATVAVDEAMSHVAPDVTLEALIGEALRRCPKPRAG